MPEGCRRGAGRTHHRTGGDGGRREAPPQRAMAPGPEEGQSPVFAAERAARADEAAFLLEAGREWLGAVLGGQVRPPERSPGGSAVAVDGVY